MAKVLQEVRVKTPFFSENGLPEFIFLIELFSAFLKFSSLCLRGEKSGLNTIVFNTRLLC